MSTWNTPLWNQVLWNQGAALIPPPPPPPPVDICKPVTRVDVELRLQLFLNCPVFYEKSFMDNSVQDGADEIAAFTGCIYKSAVVPFVAKRTYYDMLTLLPDYIGLVALWNNTIRRWMYPSSLKKFNQVRIDWDTAYGTPYYFSPINHRFVAIYMKPAAPDYGNMIAFYRAAAPVLSDNTPIPIPEEYITVLEDFSITDLWEQSQEWGKAGENFKKYVEGLEELRVLMRNQRNRDRQMSLK